MLITCSRGCAMVLAVLSLVCMGAAGNASASTIYQYTGNLFTNGERITATVELMDPLAASLSLGQVAPLSWSVSAGPVSGPSTLMLTNNSPNLDPSGFNYFRFSTDTNGSITGWSFSAHQSTSNPINCTTGATDCLGLLSNSTQPLDDARQFIAGSITYIRQVQNPGAWNVVPEPSTLSLATLGLVGFAASRRLRRADA